MPREVPADLTADAYTDVDTVDTLAESHPLGAAWLALTNEDVKEGLPALASQEIDLVDWIGDRATDDQELEWPRTGTDYSDDAWPSLVVRATNELLLYWAGQINAGQDVLNPSVADGTVSEETVGPITTKWFAPRATAATALERFPATVQRLLAPLVRVETSSWGSARVVRAS